MSAWENYHTHGYIYGQEGPEEVKESNPDGSCNWCRMEADARNDCGNCYGRGRFYTDDSEFDCMTCLGTGEKLTDEEKAKRKADGWQPWSLNYSDMGDSY